MIEIEANVIVLFNVKPKAGRMSDCQDAAGWNKQFYFCGVIFYDVFCGIDD